MAASNPYSRWIRITAVVTVASVASVAIGITLAALGVGKWPPLFFPVPVALFGLILLPILHVSGRRQGRQIDALMSGAHLAHWTYGDDEWRSFTEREWARARWQARKALLNVMLMTTVAGVLVGFARPALGLANGAKWGVLVAVPLAVLVSGLMYLIGRSTYRRRQRAPGEAWIGRDGVYQDGGYTSWNDISAALTAVKYEPTDPPAVRFDIRGHRGAMQHLRVLVPAGKDDEARTLVDSFNQAPPATFAVERTATVSVPVAAHAVDEAAGGELQLWLNDMMARFQPDKLQFREGETIGGVFQRIIAEEELAVRQAGEHPLRDIKLQALAELRKQFS